MYTSTDRHLARIRYADLLEAAAVERANRKAQAGRPRLAPRRLVMGLAAAAWIVFTIVWVLVT